MQSRGRKDWMDNERSESDKGGEAQRVDVTFPQMSIIMSHKHTHARAHTAIKNVIPL